jgi:hypothetical protein
MHDQAVAAAILQSNIVTASREVLEARSDGIQRLDPRRGDRQRLVGAGRRTNDLVGLAAQRESEIEFRAVDRQPPARLARSSTRTQTSASRLRVARDSCASAMPGENNNASARTRAPTTESLSLAAVLSALCPREPDRSSP